MDMVFTGLIGLIAVMMLALGVGPMFAPQKAVAKYYMEPNGVAGLNTMRSMIGGSFLSMMVMLVLGLVTGQTVWFLAVAVFMIVVAAGRVLGIVLDGYHKALLVPLVAEVVIAAVLIAAHYQMAA